MKYQLRTFINAEGDITIQYMLGKWIALSWNNIGKTISHGYKLPKFCEDKKFSNHIKYKDVEYFLTKHYSPIKQSHYLSIVTKLDKPISVKQAGSYLKQFEELTKALIAIERRDYYAEKFNNSLKYVGKPIEKIEKKDVLCW